MAKKISIKRYAGVFFTESKVRKWRERPDKVYWIKFKDSSGKVRWERCGWASEGWTPEAAQRRRFELLEQDRTGQYKPKQQRQNERLTFGELAEKYIEWAKESKKSWKDDEQRYRKHLAPVLAKDTLKGISPLKKDRKAQAGSPEEGPCTEYRETLPSPDPPDVQQGRCLGPLQWPQSHPTG